MMTSNQIVLAFDVYGTLLSTESIATKLATICGEEKAKVIAATWRKYQLEYTWRLNSMGVYLGFDRVTRNSMRHACLESGVELSEAQEIDMMKAYDELSVFPDVQPALKKLEGMKDVEAFAFSNGTYDMISSSMRNAPALATYTESLLEIMSVEMCRKFKPAPEPYLQLAKRVGKHEHNDKEMGQIWLVSGNPFDVVGARAVGMNAIWVDRAGNGWQDRLAASERSQPTEIVRSLEEVIGVVDSILK